MNVDYLTLFLTLGLVSLILVFNHQFDRRKRSLDKIRRYSEKTQQKLNQFIEEKTREFGELVADLEAYQSSGKEVLRQMHEVYTKISGHNDEIVQLDRKVQTYQDSLVELDQMTQRVEENLRRLEHESGFIDQLNKRFKVFQQQFDGVQAQIDNLVGRFSEANAETLRETEARIIKTAMDRTREVLEALDRGEELYQNYEKALADLELRKDNVLAELSSGMSMLFSDSIDSARDKVQEFEKTLESHYNNFDVRLRGLDRLYTDKFDSMKQQVSDFSHSSFMEIQAIIQEKSDESTQHFQSQLSSLQEYYTKRSDSLESTLLDQLRALRERNEQSVGGLSSQFQEGLEDLRLLVKEDLAHSEKSFQDDLTSMKHFAVDEIESTKTFFQRELLSLRDNFLHERQKIENSYGEFDHQIKNFEERIHSIEEGIDSSLAQQRQRGEERATALLNELDHFVRQKGLELYQEWQERFGEMKELHQQSFSEAEDFFSRYQQRLSDFGQNSEQRLSELSQLVEEKISFAHQELAHINQSYDTVIESLQKKLFDEVGRELETLAAHYQQKAQDLQKNIERLSAEYDQQLQNFSQHYDGFFHQQDQVMRDQLEQKLGAWTQELTEMSKKTEDYLLKVKDEASGLQEGLEQRFKDFRQEWQSGGEDLLNRLEEFREQSEFYGRELFMGLERDFDKKIQTLDENLSQRFASTLEGSHQVADNLDGILVQKREEITQFQGSMEEYFSSLRIRFEDVKHELAESHAQALSKGRSYGEDLAHKLREETQDLVDSVKGTIMQELREVEQKTQTKVHLFETTLGALSNEIEDFQGKVEHISTHAHESLENLIQEAVLRFEENKTFLEKDYHVQFDIYQRKYQDLLANFDTLASGIKLNFEGIQETYENKIKNVEAALQQRYSFILEETQTQSLHVKDELYSHITRYDSEIKDRLATIGQQLQRLDSSHHDREEKVQELQRKMVQEAMVFEDRLREAKGELFARVHKEKEQIYLELSRDFEENISSMRNALVHNSEEAQKLSSTLSELEEDLKRQIFSLKNTLQNTLHGEKDHLSQEIDSFRGEIEQRMTSSYGLVNTLREQMNGLLEELNGLKRRAYENVSVQLKVFEDEFFQDIQEKRQEVDQTLFSWRENLEKAWDETLSFSMKELADVLEDKVRTVEKDYQFELNNRIKEIEAIIKFNKDETQETLEASRLRLLKKLEELEKEVESNQRFVHDSYQGALKVKEEMHENMLHLQLEAQNSVQKLLEDNQSQLKTQMLKFEDQFDDRLNFFAHSVENKENDMKSWTEGFKKDLRSWQEETIARLEKETTSLAQRQLETGQKIRSLDDFVFAFEERFQRALKDASDKIEAQQEHASEKIGQRIQQLVGRIETAENLLTKEQEKVRSKLREELKYLSDGFERTLNDRRISAEQQFEQTLHTLEERVEEIQRRLDQDVARELSYGTQLKQDLEKEVSQLQREVTDMGQKFQQNWDVIKKRSQAESKSLLDNLQAHMQTMKQSYDDELKQGHGELKQVKDHLAGLYDDFQNSIRSAQEESLQRFEVHWTERVESLGQKVDGFEKMLNSQIRQYKSQEETLLSEVRERYSRINEDVLTMRRFFDEAGGEQGLLLRLRGLKKEFDGVVKSLAEDTSQLKRQKNDFSRLSADISSLRKEFSQLQETYVKLSDKQLQIDQIDARMDSVSLKVEEFNLHARDFEERVKRVNESYDQIQNIQLNLRQVLELNSQLETTMGRLDQKDEILQRALTDIARAFEEAEKMEKMVSSTKKEMEAFPEAIRELRMTFDRLIDQKDDTAQLVEQLKVADTLFQTVEERVTKAESMREWLAKTETRLNSLNQEAQEHIRLLGVLVKDQGRLPQREDLPNESVRESVFKLAQQGWSKEEIMRATKLSLGEVELILELGLSGKTPKG